ncbi:DNA topoisomerase IV subunit A [Acidothermaceae bacterium B102]|nr:DNA topoisomerase IV subunit A [Acidothermaceae bacterium B102]
MAPGKMEDMARPTPPPPPPITSENVIDVDVSAELSDSFLEYAYSVIYSRALPDARDGLKPVHRRILFQMAEMGLRPDRGHVKCARVVGDVMGKLHPHGDTAIYDALVRMAQPFSMRLPLIDGHGNFGSLGNDDPPAAMRYTECRLSAAARLLTDSLDEDVVDMVPNYDGQETEPAVLPAAYPNLLVNGGSGIAVGMATNIPPHNLIEVVAAARHLIANPDATLDELMRYIPGPDLPTGGQIIGLDGVREAYATGRGVFRIRSSATITDVTARRKGIVVTELPYTVGPEKVVAKIKELVLAKRLAGIADVKDLTDRHRGLQLVIEVKSGFNPQAVLAELYRLTPMEESFGVNAVALVDGQPRTLGLLDLLQVFVTHRLDVVRRRSEFRRTKAAARAHLLEGLLIALANIDEVVAIIRSSDDAEQARVRLMERFELSDLQARHILDMQLRRLTGLEVAKIEDELADLRETIAALDVILGSESALRELVSDELAAVSDEYGNARRTLLLEADSTVSVKAVSLEIVDAPCHVLLSSTGRIARTAAGGEQPEGDAKPIGGGRRASHDVIVSTAAATTRGEVGVVTSHGRLHRVSVLELPTLPTSGWSPNLRGGSAARELVTLDKGEHVLALVSMSPDGPGVALGTAQGVVKRVTPDYPAKGDIFELIGLRPGDSVVGAVALTTGDEDLVMITSDAQLLRTPASGVRPQGRPAGGMAGIKLAPKARVVSFGAVLPDDPDAVVVTVAVDSSALAGTDVGSVKVSALDEFPVKGRATGGVRAQRFLKGEDTLSVAWVGTGPALAADADGKPVDLPGALGKRDGSGTPPPATVAGLGFSPSLD